MHSSTALLRTSRIASLVFAAICAAIIAGPYTIGDDLPGPSSHLETVPAGSLVIPMDNTLQAVVAPFNISAYGLVNRLLQGGIPAKWAIKAGKAKDAIDFTATAQRVKPTAIAAASLNFRGGPFIVHRDFAQLALALATAFGQNVAVYQLTADTTIDVRYDVVFKPTIAVNSINAGVHTALFDAAHIPNYTVVDVNDLGSPPVDDTCCYTLLTEPHTDVTDGIANVKKFVQSGGNFLCECRAVVTYENDPAGHFQTSLGVNVNNINNVLAYPNPDLAYSQFVGVLDPNPGGSVTDWQFNPGSVFVSNGHGHADDVTTPPTYAASAAKLINGAGGMVFYLGGHNYGAGGGDITDINGQRMILNTVCIPVTRPAGCDPSFAWAIHTVSGTIYEDVNGDGNLADGVARPGVNVRLYADLNNNGVVDAGDIFLVQAPTDSSGAYSFMVSTLASGNNYLLVVDSKSVVPSAGFNGGFGQGDVWAEQTYGDNPNTAALDVGPRFGGKTGNVSDRYNTADTTPANNTYEHCARINASAPGNIPNVNFGFSFNVVTDVRAGDATDDDATANRTVQGTLRQFLQNANAITGAHAMRFVPAVAANAGSWWRISVTTALPVISHANITIDGQAYNSSDGTTVLDSNAGTVGTGGTVGANSLAFSTINKPELEIQDIRSSAVLNVGLDVQASGAAIRRLAIFGFGSSVNSDASANIRVGATASGAVIEQNVIGTGAGSFADPGAATRSGGDDVRVITATGVTIQNNAIGFSAGNGLALNSNATGTQILSNEIRGNGLTSATLSGINVSPGSGGTIQGNLVAANSGAGADLANGAAATTVVNNTFSGNGVGGAVTSGIRVLGSNQTIDRNVATGNAGAGVMVGASAAQDIITKNSIFANTGIGIDLLSASDNQSTGTAPFVTINDSGDTDTGGNGLLNFPIISTAFINGSNLVIRGYARPGSIIEFFVADPDPSNFGEGKTYVTTLTEGSAQDTDASSGTYTNPVNGLNQGTDTTNRYLFTIPTPPGVAVGTVITATATIANATSEFSGNSTVAPLQSDISGFVYNDANLNLQRDSSESGTGLTLYVKLVNTTTPGGPATAVATVNLVTGAYVLPNVAPGTYTLVLDDNNNLADVTPTLPAGWSGTEMPNGIRTPVAINGPGVPNQNFGLFHGLLITGSVFADIGTGGGVANDGVMNGTEGGIGAVTLKLTDTTGATVYGTSTTNGNGAYALAIPSTVAAGTQLKIVETNATNYVSTGATLGNTGGTYDRTTDTITFTLVANTTYTGVNFGDTPPNTFSTDGQQAGLPGTTLFYAHTYTATTPGSVAFVVNSTATPALSGWTTTIYRDTNGNGQLDSGEPEITGPVTLTAGAVLPIIAKVFIPTAAPLGAKDQNAVTANFTYTGSTPLLVVPLTRQDVTTVGNPTTAGLTLSKSVDKASALPGDTINYTVAYENNSSDTLRNVIIYDTTPVFTKFTSASNGPLPLDLTGVVITAPSVGATGAMRWTFAGTLRPGSTGTVTFRVMVDQ